MYIKVTGNWLHFELPTTCIVPVNEVRKNQTIGRVKKKNDKNKVFENKRKRREQEQEMRSEK